MRDFPLACIVSGAELFLIVFVGTDVLAAHTNISAPKFLGHVSRRPRKTLILEVPWVAGILGVGQVVILILLFHPESTTPVRVVAAAELAGVAIWLRYVWTLIFRRS